MNVLPKYKTYATSSLEAELKRFERMLDRPRSSTEWIYAQRLIGSVKRELAERENQCNAKTVVKR